MKPLKRFGDFVSCGNLGELGVHLLCDMSRNNISDLINTRKVGGGIYVLKIGYCNGCNTFLTLTPFTIIIP